MFYLLSVFIPIIILLIFYFINRHALNTMVSYVNLVFKTLPFFFIYSFVVYYIETRGLVNSGYATLAIITFLVPISIIIVILKIIFWYKDFKRKR